AAVEAGDGDANGVVRAEDAAGGFGARDGREGADAGDLEETAPSRVRHGENPFFDNGSGQGRLDIPYQGARASPRKMDSISYAKMQCRRNGFRNLPDPSFSSSSPRK